MGRRWRALGYRTTQRCQPGASAVSTLVGGEALAHSDGLASGVSEGVAGGGIQGQGWVACTGAIGTPHGCVHRAVLLRSAHGHAADAIAVCAQRLRARQLPAARGKGSRVGTCTVAAAVGTFGWAVVAGPAVRGRGDTLTVRALRGFAPGTAVGSYQWSSRALGIGHGRYTQSACRALDLRAGAAFIVGDADMVEAHTAARVEAAAVALGTRVLARALVVFGTVTT